ncbi:autophagy-related protein 11-like protein [Tanacetum coccineum]
MEELKVICPEAYQCLIDKNPNSWCKAYFRQESKCPNFDNGICKSFNRAILVQRTKPIITMLEDIRLYIMQRLVEMNRVARNWEHTITPSIRKRLELVKIAQRDWMVIPSGFGELEVRKGHESYGVNIHLRKCMCRMWQLSGIPCVHSVAAYNHMNRDPIEGVDHCYSHQKWFEAYQFRRPRKNRMKAQSENNSQVSRLGRKMTCTNCQETGHNKSSCKKEPVPKPPKVPRPPAPRIVYGTHASARVRGRGSRGGRCAFGGRGEGSENIGESSTTGMSQRGRGKGRGQRGRGSGERGRGRGERGRGGSQRGRGRGLYLKDQEEMTEDEDYETEQDEFDQEALRLTLEEEAMYKRMNEDRLKEQMAEEEWDRKMDYYHPSNWTQEEESFDHEPYNRNVNTLDANVLTQESVTTNMSNRGEIGFRLGDYEAEELGKQLA